ncbi:MAG: transcription elongation factor GreA [Bacteroidia bacterium]|nr:transcription elongation factor GreA [Bacteroidia bacterium]
MSKINYLTKDGLAKLTDKLNNLIQVERPRISQQIAEAREKGDLSENAEYDAAKDAQGLLELEISKLQEVIRNSRVIEASDIESDKVYLLSKVRIRNLATKAEMEYTLVSENEADLKKGKISVDSPIAKGILGKTKGEQVEITVPSGIMKFEIVEISR